MVFMYLKTYKACIAGCFFKDQSILLDTSRRLESFLLGDFLFLRGLCIYPPGFRRFFRPRIRDSWPQPNGPVPLQLPVEGETPGFPEAIFLLEDPVEISLPAPPRSGVVWGCFFARILLQNPPFGRCW